MIGTIILFFILLVTCFAVVWFANKQSIQSWLSSRNRKSMTSTGDVGAANVQSNEIEANAFQRKYLIVYLLAVGADWLQGPYVYALYSSYGYDKSTIAKFFIAGFGSSMIFGPFVGSVADKYGRKKLAMAYCVLYSISCICKMINSFPVLLIGRFFSGVSTSLLFSVFESWMVCEHNKRGFSDQQLSRTFSFATFGNGFIAILAGITASFIADSWGLDLGYMAPFVFAVVVFIVLLATIHMTWSENYGDVTSDVAPLLKLAVSALIHDKKIIALGLLQSMFEGCMYTFVFMWTPSLTGFGTEETCVLPLGWLFATYMVCIMIGSQLFSILKGMRGVSQMIGTVSRLAIVNYLVAAVAMLTASLSLKYRESCSQYQSVLLGAFLLFETCCGLYFPSMGTLKATYLPEKARATLMNFFRVGLNAMLVLILTQVSKINNSTVFMVCFAVMSCAAILQSWFTIATNAPLTAPAINEV